MVSGIGWLFLLGYSGAAVHNGRKNERCNMPTEDEIYQEALNASQEEELVEPASDGTGVEAEEQSGSDEAVAERETGVDESPEATEKEPEEEYGPIPYSRFSEVVSERNTLRQQEEAYRKLLEDPEIAELARQKVAEQQYVQPYGNPASGLQELKQQLSEIDLYDEDALRGVLGNVVGYLEQTTAQVQTYQQRTQAEENERANRLFNDKVTSLAADSGAELTDTERQEVYEQACVMAAGEVQFGRQPDVAKITERAYRAVIGVPIAKTEADAAKKAAEAERAKRLQQQKRDASSGRPSGAGSTVAGRSEVGDLRGSDAVDRAWEQVQNGVRVT